MSTPSNNNLNDFDILENQSPNTSNILARIQFESDALFRMLIMPSFDCVYFIEMLREQVKTHSRIYYSVFSNIVFKLNDVETGVLNSNLDILVDFTDKQEFNDIFFNNSADENEKNQITKIIFKIWDHAHLACNQVTAIKKDGFYEQFIPEKDRIQQSIKEEGHQLNKELISMVAIFTAMAFLVFGGLNSLSTILESSVIGVPVLNISIVCLLWGLCVYNMIYLFMFLVGKIIDKDISTNKDSKNLFRRHIIFFTGNLVLLYTLFIVGWLYFLKIDFKNWYSKLYTMFKGTTPWLPPLIVTVIFILIFIIVCGIFRHIDNANRTSTD